MPPRLIDPAAPHLAFGATPEQWADWHWQQRNAIRTLAQLEAFLDLSDDERRGVDETAKIFRLGISPYYLSLCDPQHPFCPVRMQAVPTRAEATIHSGELADPLGEDSHRPVPAIVHRYPDRVLFLALDRCSVYCRHCTRRRMTGSGETDLGKDEIAQGIEYVRAHPEVRDVLISGGDPFLLATQKLEGILAGLRAIPHVQMIRIGTRVPVCLPMRVDAELCAALRKHHPVFVVTHFNHPKELTADAKAACERLVDAGIPVENQCVLLRRVNSTARTMTELSHKLLMARVRPYYMHQADVAEGIEHLRTPLAKGVEILEQMRGHTSGLAVPHFAIDLPGGGGKVTLQPNYLLSLGARETVFRNYRNEIYRYPEPEERDCTCPYDEVFYRA
jgi:lysine 2,3-aminomutase